MRIITKGLWMILVIGVLTLGLASCKEPEENNNGAVDDDVIYSPYVKTTIILGEGVEERDVAAVKTAYNKAVGAEIKVGDADKSYAHEIIIGKTDRELSERAYRYLERFKGEEDYVGYVIYSDGKNAAVAFDEASFGENVAFDEAIEKFVSEYMKSASLKLSAGVTCKDSFNPIEKQNERDEASIERLWSLKLSQITKNAYDKEEAEAIVKELEGLYRLLNDEYDIVKWLANLYDPETGGFYYSNSARNNQGYLPDLESTAQALGIIESILTDYGGTLTDYFGEEIASKFVSFAKNMQKPNGYFYHPQWSVDLTNKNMTRRTRDVLAALNILNCFNASPVYDTPNGGVKGEGAVVPASKLASPLRYSKAIAAAELVSGNNNEIYIPSHLKSKEAFETYLVGLKIRTDTEAACKALNSEFSLYMAIDEILEEKNESYRLGQVLADHLAQNQNYSTGLWSSSAEATAEDISLLSEIAKLYNGLRRSMPNYRSIFITVKEYLKFDEEPENISFISGAWSALAAVVNNITTYGAKADEYTINSALSTIYSGFDETLNKTAEKLALFRRQDGSFSTTPTASAHEQFGMSVALPMMDEGDMNATLLASKSTWLSIFRVLNVADVPIFAASDRMMFQKTLLDMGIIIKNEIKETEPKDFENYEIGDAADVNIVEKGAGTKYSEVVFGSEERGNVLKLYSSSEAGQDEFHFAAMSTVYAASCYSYELYMCVTDEYDEGMSSFIILYKYLHLIGIEREGNVVKLTDRSSQWGAACVQDIGARAAVGEWFKLRVEYYPITNKTVRTKIYFANETEKERCIAVTDSYFGQDDEMSAPSTNYEGLAIFATGKKEMSILVDDVVTESTYKTYSPETAANLNINVDAPDKNQTLHDFESTPIGSTPTGFKPAENSSPVTVVKVDDGDTSSNFLSVSEGAGEIILPLDRRGSDANSAVIEFDIIIDESSAVGAGYRINFNEYMYLERSFASMQLTVIEDGGVKYAALAEVSSGNAGEPDYGTKLRLGTKHRLRFQLFFEERALVVSVISEDGVEIVAVSGNVISDCRKYYMGEVTLEAVTPAKKSTAFIDNLVCERIRSSFEEMTNPEKPRKEYGFDETDDDMTIKGVTVSDSRLSFERVSGSEGYIKIPINKRVSVPTLTVVKVDVTATAATGELVIRLTDNNSAKSTNDQPKEDNTVAAVSLVRNKERVDIYEYTANGRYKTPIYTVDASEFSLSIKYNESKQSYNLFINDIYATSSSLIYTEESGAYKVENLYIGCTASAGFAIDNLYAEKICGIFVTNVPSDTNPDDTSEVITYEGSSFASMPSKIEPSLGALSSSLNIKEDKIDDEVTKVLEFYSNAEAADIIFFKKTGASTADNAAFFETDMMLKSNGDKMMSLMQFRAVWNSSYPTVYNFRLETNGPNEPIQLTTNDAKIDLKVKEGEWFKLRIEYADTPYDYNYDGENDPVVRVYVNDMKNPLGEGHTLNNSSTMPPASTVTQVRVTVSQGYDGSVRYDNTSLGQFAMKYEKPIEPDKETLTFSPGVLTDKTTFVFGKKDLSYADITVEDEVNKVLLFHTGSGSEDKLYIALTQLSETANAISFETDIKITPASGTQTFYLQPETADKKYPFRLTLKATAGGNVTISADDITEKAIGKSGEWIHLRVEYMNPMLHYNSDGIPDILYKIYSDKTEETLVGYKVYSSASYFDPVDITKFVITSPSASEADILFDNVEFWQTQLTPDKAPDLDEAGTPTVGDNWFNNSGWS